MGQNKLSHARATFPTLPLGLTEQGREIKREILQRKRERGSDQKGFSANYFKRRRKLCAIP